MKKHNEDGILPALKHCACTGALLQLVGPAVGSPLLQSSHATMIIPLWIPPICAHLCSVLMCVSPTRWQPPLGCYSARVGIITPCTHARNQARGNNCCSSRTPTEVNVGSKTYRPTPIALVLMMINSCSYSTNDLVLI